MKAAMVSRAHKWGHFLYEIRDERGIVVAKIACTPEFIRGVLGVELTEVCDAEAQDC